MKPKPTMQTPDATEAGPSQGRYKPYASPEHQVTRGRYITSNDPRGFIPVFEYPLNGQWIMMDADDGYILWTGIWKALGNSKADIVRMLEARPDWAPQVRRVRGGYLKIQGTWLPYETALMLSRRVGYPIRNDLIPLFGPSFPDTCLTPGQVGYGQVLPTVAVRRRRRPVQTAQPAPTPPSPPQPQGSADHPSRPYSESPVDRRQYNYDGLPSSYPPPSAHSDFGPIPPGSSRFAPYPASSSPSTPWSPSRHARTPSSSAPANLSAPALHPSTSFDIANGGLRLPPITTGSSATYAEHSMEDARDVLRRLSEPDEYPNEYDGPRRSA